MIRGLTLIMMLTPVVGWSQFLSPAQLDTAYVYSSMEEALENPEEVYVLHLKVKKGKIPERLFELPYLHVLEMKRGRITELPAPFSKLNNLVRLDLTNNRLTYFPSVLLEMPQLEQLHLGKNEIQRIPEGIKRMENLRLLDIWSTQVPRLPLALAEMKSLEEVDMRMIEISQEEQDYFTELMPHVQFLFSVPCNCR